jgi:DNA-directed RNA polymerase specialized sigma24 family protein
VDVTRQSLLLRAQTGDPGAWKDLTALYRPLLVGWLRYQAVPVNEVDDLVQEILLAVVQHLPAFSHSGRVGAFRGWLRTIAHNRACDFWKARDRQQQAAGGKESLEGEVGELRGHDDYVHAVAWSPDGTRLISASGDRTVRIWDSLSAQERAKRGAR